MKNKILFSSPVATHTQGMVLIGFLNTISVFLATFYLSLLPLSLAFIPNVFLKSIFWKTEAFHGGLMNWSGICGFTFLHKWHILYSLVIHLQTLALLLHSV